MSENKFDSYVQEKLKGYKKPEFEERYWDSMEALLDKQDKPGAGAWKWIVPTAVAVVTAVSVMVAINVDRDIETEASTALVNKAQTEAPGAISAITENSEKEQSIQRAEAKSSAVVTLSNSTNSIRPPVNTQTVASLENPAAGKMTSAAPVEEELSFENSSVAVESTPLARAAVNEERVHSLTPVELIDIEVNNISGESEPGPTGKILPQAKDKGNSAAAASAPWQSILYHFWDNAAYTGMEGKASFNVNDKTKFFPSYGLLERVNHVGMDMQLLKGKAGIGMYYRRNAQPFNVNTQTGIMASANIIKIGVGQLRAGFGGEIITEQYSEGGAMRLADRINPALNVFSSSGENKSYSMGAGLNTGLWYSSERLIAGAAMNNFNRPIMNTYYRGRPLPAELNLTAGYKFKVAQFEIMPWVEMSKVSEQTGKLNALVFLSYGHKAMLGAGVRNLDQTTDRTELVVYGGTDIAKRLRIFTSYSHELIGTKNHIHPATIHSGIRYRIP